LTKSRPMLEWDEKGSLMTQYIIDCFVIGILSVVVFILVNILVMYSLKILVFINHIYLIPYNDKDFIAFLFFASPVPFINLVFLLLVISLTTISIVKMIFRQSFFVGLFNGIFNYMNDQAMEGFRVYEMRKVTDKRMKG
jgi:hypothetical protein